MPETGDRHTWHKKVFIEMGGYPEIRSFIDEKLATLRSELARLDRLWKKARG
jgi:hypothetical protein